MTVTPLGMARVVPPSNVPSGTTTVSPAFAAVMAAMGPAVGCCVGDRRRCGGRRRRGGRRHAWGGTRRRRRRWVGRGRRVRRRGHRRLPGDGDLVGRRPAARRRDAQDLDPDIPRLAGKGVGGDAGGHVATAIRHGGEGEAIQARLDAIPVGARRGFVPADRELAQGGRGAQIDGPGLREAAGARRPPRRGLTVVGGAGNVTGLEGARRHGPADGDGSAGRGGRAGGRVHDLAQDGVVAVVLHDAIAPHAVDLHVAVAIHHPERVPVAADDVIGRCMPHHAVAERR